MNAFHVVVLAFTIVGAVYWIPRAIRYDKLLAEMEGLDDESLAAALEEFPDPLDWRTR